MEEIIVFSSLIFICGYSSFISIYFLFIYRCQKEQSQWSPEYVDTTYSGPHNFIGAGLHDLFLVQEQNWEWNWKRGEAEQQAAGIHPCPKCRGQWK